MSSKVNESLSKNFAYKGPDKTSEAERKAYEACRPLSAKHESCYLRMLYAKPEKQKSVCGPMLEEWKRCYSSKVKSASGSMH